MPEADRALVTERLRLRELTDSDAGFIVELLNDPDFLRFIGDREVRDEAAAIDYLAHGPIRSYRDNGFGLLLIERRADGLSVGTCGLLRRDGLDAPDLGFALLPPFRGHGYAFEAARAVLRHAFACLGIARVVAIVAAKNEASAHLLGKLGMTACGTVRLKDDAAELQLFELERRHTRRSGNSA